jgi:DNA invertase Pin-like site-specific DNA recombinase
MERLDLLRAEEPKRPAMSRRTLGGAAAVAPMPTTVRKLRCAIYTRKSTEEGLNQAFNTLHAQYDACRAYIDSQRAEGWLLLPDRYDDGGFSGGTLERPALKRLLLDVERGHLDIVVTYKLDRLSRSLTDFVRMMEKLEAHEVTFVSVTQAFNTTTSMGRLTLNILLSFAQFEREVIGERIRDKFAASRARGMWMGGKVPLGYDVHQRKLVVNQAEAATVRRVFEGFAELGSGTRLTQMLRSEGVITKRGKPINKGDIYKLLDARVYLGEAVHKGTSYPGEHQAIVPRELWDRVHAVLTESPRSRANRNRSQTPALLRGLIFGTDGRAMSPTHTRRRGRLYRYYVSQNVLKGVTEDPAIVRRVAAAEIESAVVDQLRVLLRQPEIIVGTWCAARADVPDLTEAEVRKALEQLDPLWDELFPAEQARIVRLLVERVVVGPDGADIQLRVAGLTSLLHELGPKDNTEAKSA